MKGGRLLNLRVLRPRPRPETSGEPRPSGEVPRWRRWLRVPTLQDLRTTVTHNAGLKGFSLLLAFFLWFSINVSERDAEGTLELPVRIAAVAPGYLVTNQQPSKPITVTVRGPRTILNGVDERRSRFELDLSSATPPEVRLEFHADMIRPELPRRLKVVRIDPARVKIRLERLVHRRLKVKADVAGQPALGYTTAAASVTPNEIEVSGPASKVDELTEIKTEPVYLRRTSDSFQRSVLLSWAGDYVSFVPDRVTVAVSLTPTMMSRVYENVPIAVRNVPAGLAAKLTPASLELTLSGPQRLLNGFAPEAGAAFVDAAGLTAGTHRVPPEVGLPQGFEVTGREPGTLTLELTPKGKR